jgi:hypothetical protein
MPTNEHAASRRPTQLLERWRAECQRALAQAAPDGADDRLVALIVGAYFHAIHSTVEVVHDPHAQERFCEDEAVRFLAMLRDVPNRRRQILEDQTDARRRAGLLVFPDSPPADGDRREYPTVGDGTAKVMVAYAHGRQRDPKRAHKDRKGPTSTAKTVPTRTSKYSKRDESGHDFL